MQMQWHNLLFAHWPLPVDELRQAVPVQLTLDTYEGRAWIGVVPFLMSGVRPRLVPGTPGSSCFPEINVRTYVTMDGKPGVYFFSLDAGSWFAVKAARAWYHLPYFLAKMQLTTSGSTVDYKSDRCGNAETRFDATYSPIGPVMSAQPGSLDHWLTERYCLYTVWKQRVYRADIHHDKWPLKPAEAEIRVNTMAEPLGLTLPQTQPVLHYAERLDVVAWAPTAAG